MMNRVKRAVLFPFVLAAWSGLASAAPLQPNGKWLVHFEDSQCVVTRLYGEKQDIQLQMKLAPTGESFQLLVGRPGSFRAPEDTPASAVIGDAPVVKTSVLRYAADGRRVDATDLPSSALSSLAKAEALSITGQGVYLDLALPGFGKVKPKMDECLASLQDYWNVGDAYASRLTSAATGNIVAVIENDDYPKQSLRKSDQGTAHFTLLVDADGKVADCTVTQSSGVAALDSQSCARARTAKFQPAMGSDGKPARSAVAARIRWMLPSR